ncbi:MAG: hypothetical protein ACKVZJ_09425 [Phycisphaerales bacterium]
MDALTIISQATPTNAAAGGAHPPINAGMLFSIVGACATSALLALIIARALKLHKARAVRRSVGVRTPARAATTISTAALIEPKPLHPQRAA